MEIPVLFEDKYLVVISKPNGMLVHTSSYSGKSDEETVTRLLAEQLKDPFYTVHRLDRKTSGLLVFCKKPELVKALQRQAEEGSFTKEYLALLRGYMKETGEITSPVKSPYNDKYKEAYTKYESIAQIELPFPVPPYENARYSLVKFRPLTGRMHQLRIHANKISHPIIGDPRYGNRHHNHYFADHLGINQLFLHAGMIRFVHPVKGTEIQISAPLPDFWLDFFKKAHWNEAAEIISQDPYNH